MKYGLAIFDMDGTILDTLDDLTTALNCALRDAGMPPRTRDEVCAFVGNGAGVLLDRAAAEGASEKDREKLRAAFGERYAEHCEDTTHPYDGIPELLAELRAHGCKTAVVSNKADFAVRILAEKYFGGLFDAAEGEHAGVRRKPAPDAVNALIEQFGAERAQTVYIGDSDVDIATARNAGVDCISVCWGFRTREFLQAHGASRIVSDADDLRRLLIGG